MIDGIPLIDAHVHVVRFESSLKVPPDQWVFGTGDDARAIYDADGMPVPERLHAFLQREGVDLAFCMCEYSPRVTGDQRVEDMLPLVKYDPDRLRFIANVNPHLHHPITDEFERQLELGAVALKIHPVHGGFPANERRLYPVYWLCQGYRLPVVFHCGTSVFPGASNGFADPVYIEDVARDFPDLTIILAHGGRGWWYDAAAFMALSRDNVWIELSGLPPKRLPTYYRNADLDRLAAKFIFATDWPGAPGIKVNAEAVRDVLTGLGIDREILERVFYRNAASLYRIDGHWTTSA
ncbi:MAG: amidohydrolase family protein [Streptosporangiales bacterium]|nr:amidohydrolase family protein [Streptosporangiales bacterium]